MSRVSGDTFVGEGKIMKRYLWVFLFLTSTSYAEVNQTGPYIVGTLKKQVTSLTNENSQIKRENETLKRQLADKDREIEWLKHLCRKNNIDPNEQSSFRGADIGDPKNEMASTRYTEVNQTGPYIVRSLQKQIETLTQENQQIKQANEQLKQQLADKDREVERLQALCRKNNIDPNVRFSFRGAHIGDPKNKMAKQISVKPQIKKLNGLERFKDNSVEGRLGDIPINYLWWNYLDDKLVGFLVAAKSNVFDQFRDYLIARYGEPDAIERGTIQNAMGATFPSIILVWETPDGRMLLINPSGNIDELALSITQVGIDEELDRRDKEIAKQNAGKAF